MPEFIAMPTEQARTFKSGAPDAHGRPPERSVSKGANNDCRHCLNIIPEGEDMLVLAYKPFESTQPYAEIGPVFLCGKACERGGGTELPGSLRTAPDYLLRGYSDDDRIVYGTGAVVPQAEMAARFEAIFTDPNVAYIHIRSARNNCYQARVERG